MSGAEEAAAAVINRYSQADAHRGFGGSPAVAQHANGIARALAAAGLLREDPAPIADKDPDQLTDHQRIEARCLETYGSAGWASLTPKARREARGLVVRTWPGELNDPETAAATWP